MKNDIISRSELKKVINDFYDSHFIGFVPNELITYANAVDTAIDIAPTVELFCAYLSDGEVRQPCIEAPCKHERPQGEWIIDGHHIRCNKCNEYICIQDIEGAFIPDNFCPNCGAKMKNGG